MAPRAPKICSHRSGCTKLDGGDGTGRCADHKRPAWEGSKRGHATGQTDHRARRQRILTRDLGVCQLAYDGCTGKAFICDHIRPIAAGGAESDRNTWAVCPSCHKIKSDAERAFLQYGTGEQPWPDDPALKADPSDPQPLQRRPTQKQRGGPGRIATAPKPINLRVG